MVVRKRIIVSVLRMVEHTYINIEAQKLAGMLDVESSSDLLKVVDTKDMLTDLSSSISLRYFVPNL